MSDNASHPLFTRDAQLRDEYDEWVRKTTAPLPASPQKERLINEVDHTNTMADNARDLSIADLDKLDKAYSVNRAGEPGTKQATPQDKAYENGRADIMARFSEVNDRLWKRRETLGNQINEQLDRLNIKRDIQTARLPTIIQASKPTAARQSYAEFAKARPAMPTPSRDQESERD